MIYKAKRKGKGDTRALSFLAFTATTVTLFTTWFVAMVSPVVGCATGVIMFLGAGCIAEKLEGGK